MCPRARSVAAALAATLVLALAAGPAGAQLEVSETRIRATSSALTFRANEVSIVCAVTLDLTLGGERIGAGTTAGSVTAGTVNEAGCTGGRVRLLSGTLPWPVRLVSFTQGIVTLQIEGLSGLVDAAGGLVRCLYRGNVPAANEDDPARRLRVEGNRLGLVSRLGGITCPAEASIAGQLTLAPEVGYTESTLRGLGLRPQPAVVDFRGLRVPLGVNFINEQWLAGIIVTEKAILNAGRVVMVEEANECRRWGRIGPGQGCGPDRIELIRAKELAEPEGEYALLTLGKIVGIVNLRE